MIFQENILVRVSFDRFAGLNECNFIKKRLQHKCFSGKLVKFLRTPVFKEHLQWLFLGIISRNDMPKKCKSK